MSVFHRSPISASSGQKSVSRLFEVVSIICQASQGTVSLVEALRRTGGIIGSEVTSICRVDFKTSARPVKVIGHGLHGSGAARSQDPGISFAKDVCSEFIGDLCMGSVLSAHLSDFEDNPTLAEFYRRRRLVETIIMPLDRKNGVIDLLELHYRSPVSSAELAHLELIGPVLAECWGGRSLGLFSDALLSGSRSVRNARNSGEILSMENPCRLSRAEYRVCLLLSRGLNNKAVLSELSITMATLRTHLGNIYAKTGATSQSDLVHMLLVSQTARKIYRIGSSDVA